jgi:hypothetical protein
MAVNDTYDETVDVEEVVRTPDGLGGWTEAWSPTIEDLPCHVWALSGDEIDEYAKKQVEADYGLMCAVQTAPVILEANRVNWGGRLFDITFIQEVFFKSPYMALALLEKPND